MKLETFFVNFEFLTDAPNAVANLRGLILQLAVQGKLVKQNIQEESLSNSLTQELCKEINNINQRILKNSNNLLTVAAENQPYKVPINWIWKQIGEIVIKSFTGLEKAKIFQSEEYEYIYFKMNNISSNGRCDFSNITRVSASTEEVEKYQLINGDFLFNTRNSYELVGKTCVFVNELNEGVLFNNNILKIIFSKSINPNYVNIWFISPIGKELLNKLKSATTNVAAIYQSKLMGFVIPMPPKDEQKRIIEKCDRLLSICDEIEKRQQQRQESIVRMNESAIAQLLSSQNPDEFRQNWQRICNNFDLLYSIPETIPKLRQAILQLGVQGKLVRQEFDESGLRYLIERITEERLALCPNEKDKQRILSEFAKIIEESNQGKTEEFEIPAICICDFITKGTTPSNSELLPEGEIPYLKVYNIVDNKIDFFYKPTYISRTVHTTKLKRSLVCPGDVLMNIVGPPLGKIAIVPDDFPEWNINQALAVFRPVDSVYNRFIYYALSCHTTLEKVLNETKGTAGQDNLSLEQCRSLRIPLYTIETQKRIVEKCDRLMSLCDALEAKLKQGRDSSEKLMEVAAKQVLTA